MLLFICYWYINTQKAQTSCCLLAVRGLRITHLINKQQETYAGMKTRYTIERCSMDIIIPIGIYCYFGFIKYSESCEVSNNKTQSAINAVQYVRNLPKKEPLRNAFRRTYSLQRRIRGQRYEKNRIRASAMRFFV